MKPYDPQVGEIWWFGGSKKHYLFLDKKACEPEYSSYVWDYTVLCFETGTTDTIKYGTMNAYGEGWFKRLA